MIYQIYILICPLDGLVKYVGVTQNPKKRLQAHMCSYSANKYKDAWIAKLTEAKLLPIMHIVETCTDKAEKTKLEIYWIHQFRSWGYKLANRMLYDGKQVCNVTTTIVTEKQMSKIHGSLEQGEKKLLANELGIKQTVLSKYLNLQHKRNRLTGNFESKYIIPTEIYNKIIDFLNQ